jgi:hypothetical protein
MNNIFEHPLAKKIAFVTAIKLLGLFVIWWFFFSEPNTNSLTPEQVGNAILHPTNHITTTP